MRKRKLEPPGLMKVKKVFAMVAQPLLCGGVQGHAGNPMLRT